MTCISASIFHWKACQAIDQHEEHVFAFQEFDAALSEKDVMRWTAMVQAWEKTPENKANSLLNPFVATVVNKLWFLFVVFLILYIEITENTVHLELALEDEVWLHEDLISNIHNAVYDDVPPGHLIAQGLELEDHQYVFDACLNQQCLTQFLSIFCELKLRNWVLIPQVFNMQRLLSRVIDYLKKSRHRWEYTSFIYHWLAPFSYMMINLEVPNMYQQTWHWGCKSVITPWQTHILIIALSHSFLCLYLYKYNEK